MEIYQLFMWIERARAKPEAHRRFAPVGDIPHVNVGIVSAEHVLTNLRHYLAFFHPLLRRPLRVVYRWQASSSSSSADLDKSAAFLLSLDANQWRRSAAYFAGESAYVRGLL